MPFSGVAMSPPVAWLREAVSAARNPPGVMFTPLNRIVVGPLSSLPCPGVAATGAFGSAAARLLAALAAALLAARFATDVFSVDVVVFTSAEVAAASVAFTLASVAREFAAAA